MWVRGGDQRVPSGAGTDAQVNLDGYISITPMRADLTAHDMIPKLQGLLG
jgi:5'-nucleotidase